MLFIPANARRELFDRAHLRGGDAIILDLEDAVAPDAKARARELLPGIITDLAGRGIDVLVRINSSLEAAVRDLHAAVSADIRGIVVPKVEELAHLDAISRTIEELETKRGLREQDVRVGLVAMAESPAALSLLPQVAAMERVVGLALGGEDFSIALGVPPSAASLTLPCQMIAIAAAAHGIMAFGLPRSVAAFDDLDAYAKSARLARAIGLTGALCIHPAQVPVINEAFSVSDAEYDAAEQTVIAWNAAVARGESVLAVDGRMIDRPVVVRAQMLLAGGRRR
jgi:citrate lyase subunit beta/citryl-CoA lyase